MLTYASGFGIGLVVEMKIGGPCSPIILAMWRRNLVESNALVLASAGFTVVWIFFRIRIPLSLHSCTANVWMSTCLVRFVGFPSLTMSMVALLSSAISVAFSWEIPIWFVMVRTHLIIFPAKHAATNSPSVELIATIDCILFFQQIRWLIRSIWEHILRMIASTIVVRWQRGELSEDIEWQDKIMQSSTVFRSDALSAPSSWTKKSRSAII